jgi:16S rRNA (guanine1207-N2)-methyltransferase
MTRWSQDPDRAADALILRSLPDIEIAGRALLVNPGQSLPSTLAQGGADCTVWNRRLGDGMAGAAAAPWPPPGPFDMAFVRLPKARDEVAMTVQATLSVLRAGGRLALYGGNDEGIRPAASLLERLAGTVEALAARGHGRVLAAHRPEAVDGLRGSLAAWRTVAEIAIGGSVRTWIGYPGCFAAGRLDEGTALLIAHLPPLARAARVLDYGCGTGPIAAAALAEQPSALVDALDSDSVALEATRENVPGARPILGMRLADAGRRDYRAILSNPPLHQGIAEDRHLLERLIADAPAHLAPAGCLQIVVQRRVPVERQLARHFSKVETLAATGRYRIWRASIDGEQTAPVRPEIRPRLE